MGLSPAGEVASQVPLISLVRCLQTESSELEQLNSTVQRRFSEFVWVRQQLQQALPMVVVPALPEKKVVGRFTPELVRSRQRGLQRFLQRCSQNTSITEHVVFQNFLSLTADEFARFKEARNTVTQPAVGDTIMSKLSSFARMVGGAPKTKRTDADISVATLEQYAASVEPLLSTMSTILDKLQAAELDTAQGLSEFGSAYGMLGAAEGRSLGEALQATGQCARQVATVVGSAAHSSTQLLSEDMQDAARMVHATQHVFESRQAARLQYSLAVEALQKAKVELSKAGGASAGEAGAKAAAQVQAAQERSTAAEDKLHQMTLQLADSMETFRAQHLSDFLAAWCRASVAQARKAAVEAELWEGIAQSCQEAATVEASAAPYLSATPPAAPGSAQAAASAEGSPDGSPRHTPAPNVPDTPQEHSFADGSGTPSGDEQGEFV